MISTRSSSLGPRRVGGDDGQDDVVLVQHLVVLEIVQQRGRREIRIAGEEHRRARHDVRRLLLQAADQRIDRHFDAARLLNQDAAAALPRDDQQHHQDAEQDRQPRALQELQQVRGQERRVDEDERHHQQRRLPPLPLPQPPDHDEAEDPVDHHRGGHRDAVGVRQLARRVGRSARATARRSATPC